MYQSRRLYSNCNGLNYYSDFDNRFIVTDKSRNGFYAVVLGGTLCIFGYVGYVLAKELVSPNGSYYIIDQTVKKLESDPETCEHLGGPPFQIYGTSDGRRRRLNTNQQILEDGRKQVNAVFWIEGGLRRAKVTVNVVEDEDGGWRERYLATEVPGEVPRILVRPVEEIKRSSVWNPFSRWF